MSIVAKLSGGQSLRAEIGAKQVKGMDGATFTPTVSPEGVLSWTNDKELENPESVNIKGEKGDKGDKGDKGADGTMTFEDLTPDQKASLKGDKGDKGDTGSNGADGKTPEKGTDYFTDADKAEIVSAVLDEVPEAPVQSVNGKSGAVQLSASDVGAAEAETWNGKPVYKKLVDCGETGTSDKYVDTGLYVGDYDIIGFEAYIRGWSLIVSRRANVQILNTDSMGESFNYHVRVMDTYELVPDTCKVLIKYVEK